MTETQGKQEAQDGESPAEAAASTPTPWPAPDDRGLVVVGGVHFDRGAVQLLRTEYTPDEIIAGLAGSSPAAWVRRVNREHLERHGIGRLMMAGVPGRPVITGRRFDDRERRGRRR